MSCPNCGTENPDGSRFCGGCGASFENEAPITEIPEAPVLAEDVQPVEQSIPEQPVEQPAPDFAVSQPVPEQPVEQPAPDFAVTQPVPEQPIEQPAPDFTVTQPVPEQSVEQPAPDFSVTQPVYEQPVQPQFQQPMPQQYQQPMYNQPYPQQPAAPRPPRKPMDPKTKKKVIIGSACGAVLAAFLIVLFAAIIPNSGLKGRLRHTWRQSDTTRVNIMDLKAKRLTSGSTTYTINNWQAQGDRLAISYSSGGFFDVVTETYVVAFSPDGKKLYLFDAVGYSDGDRPDMVFVRAD